MRSFKQFFQYKTSATWLIPQSNWPQQRLKLQLLKEPFHPNAWPITKWPFITLTPTPESCQCLRKYSATVLSVSSQDTLSSVSTLPWLCLSQKYTNAAAAGSINEARSSVSLSCERLNFLLCVKIHRIFCLYINCCFEIFTLIQNIWLLSVEKHVCVP